MELATRVFDVVTAEPNVHPEIRASVPELADKDGLRYWRRVLRMAALCHDVGHIPFSHGSERLLPEGWNHERLTVELVRSRAMDQIWARMTPPLRSDDIAKLAVGPAKSGDIRFSDWEAVLAEIIVGDAFGVDRMDYLLRDSHHTGVAYGRFDHFRLIDTLRILPSAAGGREGASTEPELGVEEGGLHSAEALLLARYFMFTQVYFHHVRLGYDIHLGDFLKTWLKDGYPTGMARHLRLTDTDVTAAITEAARKAGKAGHAAARGIVHREHWRVLWELNPEDLDVNPRAGEVIYTSAVQKFGIGRVRRLSYADPGAIIDFPVMRRDGSVVSAQALSSVMRQLPHAAYDYVFVEPALLGEAESWLKRERSSILKEKIQGEE
jgi:hypothetical protein